ncbi:MAG: (2Fe-2S) ferredoxin domain-containing protein, partial [bacterium]
MIQTREELKNRALELGMEQARGPRSRILVSMGTCGVAAGTTPVLEAIRREVENRDLDKAYEVVETGCMGLCHSEPSIEVVDTVSGNSAFYVNVKPDQAAA